MADAAIISETLEQVAARCADPTERVYKRLFELNPEYEPMFVMDTDGGVRGAMLETCIACVLGIADGERGPRLQIEAARMIHDGFGLVDDEIDLMFVAMRDVFRDIIAGNWTQAMETEWERLLGELARIV